MLLTIKQDYLANGSKIDFVTFSQFLIYFMSKSQGNDTSQVGALVSYHPGQLRKDTLRALKYGPKDRSILHQLVEDNKLVLFRDLLNLNS